MHDIERMRGVLVESAEVIILDHHRQLHHIMDYLRSVISNGDVRNLQDEYLRGSTTTTMRDIIERNLRDTPWNRPEADPIGDVQRAWQMMSCSAGIGSEYIYTPAPHEDMPSGDAMSMRFDLAPTDTCWKKVSGIECGEPSDPDSETGACTEHMKERKYKR